MKRSACSVTCSVNALPSVGLFKIRSKGCEICATCLSHSLSESEAAAVKCLRMIEYNPLY